MASSKSLDTWAMVCLSEVQDTRKYPELLPALPVRARLLRAAAWLGPVLPPLCPGVLHPMPRGFAIPTSATTTLWVTLWQHAKLLQKLRPDVALWLAR